MIPVTCMAGRRLALFGLGTSGIATARALIAGGAKIVAWDDDAKSVEAAKGEGIFCTDLREIDWSSLTALVLAPGVPLTHPEPHWTVDLARKANVEIVGDIELFCRERAATMAQSPFIAITGTNGKSTTTALVSHILSTVGLDVQMGGNIGTPILALKPFAPGRVHIIECSSFQIDLAPSIDPTIAVLLNISQDHLDRHGSFGNYIAVKERMLIKADLALIGVDDPYSFQAMKKIADGKRRVACFSGREKLSNGFYAKMSAAGTRIIWKSPVAKIVVADLRGSRVLRGAHNAQNAAAACAIASALTVKPEAIDAAIKTFPGLPHRLEELGQIDNVLFINDSKATNAESAEKALLSFSHIFWILGGKPKEGGITSLVPNFDRVKKAYLVGEAAPEFAKTLEGKVPYEMCETLDVAVMAAARDAAALKTSTQLPVLLSPACASYDQYRNFEIRGDHFRTLVKKLPGFTAAA
jgi:UDP-N-acetylmuramoylalanine--D-glutamate ligase